MKKLLVFLLTLCLLMSGLTPAFADEAGKPTYKSGDYSYQLNDDGTAVITYYRGSDTNLTIPDTLDGYTVTSIGEKAFYYCKSLTSVTIPDSVSSIGYWVFGRDTTLIVIPRLSRRTVCHR